MNKKKKKSLGWSSQICSAFSCLQKRDALPLYKQQDVSRGIRVLARPLIRRPLCVCASELPCACVCTASQSGSSPTHELYKLKQKMSWMKALPPPSPSLPQITQLENIKQLSCTYSNSVMCSGSAEGDSRQCTQQKKHLLRGGNVLGVCVCVCVCVCSAACVLSCICIHLHAGLYLCLCVTERVSGRIAVLYHHHVGAAALSSDVKGSN